LIGNPIPSSPIKPIYHRLRRHGDEGLTPPLMKTTPIIHLFILMLFCYGTPSTAQENTANRPLRSVDKNSYKTAIGFRAGSTSGLTVKQFVNQHHALEGIVGFWPNAMSVTLLYEFHAEAFNTAGFYWYYGAGGHVAFEANERYNDGRRFDRGDRFGVGIDGILGLEYKILPIPFALSLDVKPFVEFNNNGNIYSRLDPGLGIKFTF
jgi:hypothetical protein